MKILALDTSTNFLCLGVFNNGKTGEYNLEVGRKLSALLVPKVKEVLEAAGMKITEVDYFACGLGPGSFTGMRTGIAAIKGFALALNKPVIGISTLDILAKAVGTGPSRIIPMLDAKRNLIYCSFFKNAAGRLAKLKPDLLLSKEELFRMAKPKSIVLGDALNLYRQEILANIKDAVVLDKDFWYPKAHSIIELALERIAQKKFKDAFNIKPIYLYPKECQIKVTKT